MSLELSNQNSATANLLDQIRSSVYRFNKPKILLSDTCLTRNRLCVLLLAALVILFYVLMSSNLYYSPISTIGVVSDERSAVSPCRWVFHHYSASPWEKYWSDNILSLQNNVCPTLMGSDQFNKSLKTLQYVIESQKSLAKQSFSSPEYDALLSKMYYRYNCSNSKRAQPLVSQYIEPLIGLLRDPLTICAPPAIPPSLVVDYEGSVLSKRFFLLGPSAAIQNYTKPIASIAPWLSPSPTSQNILFDIGASYFAGSSDPSVNTSNIGARWFYQYFRSHSLSFDRIIAFEVGQYPAQTYWAQIPQDLIGKLTFINTGVETSGKFNPWDVLKRIAKVDDYVIIKLDIDTPGIESELANQIVNDPSIYSLIDEMFFEMHISVNEMRGFWGSPPGELKDTYTLFTKIRQLGIRMHSWP